MNRKILQIYYKSLFSVIFITLFLWIVLSMAFILYGKSVDTSLPQYLIRSVENETTFENNQIIVSKNLKRKLEKYGTWMQLISSNGTVLYSYNTTNKIPQKYDTLDLANYCLESNRLSGYTLFSLRFTRNPNYGVVLGCKNSVVSKISYIFTQNGRDEIVQLCILLLIITVLMIVFSSFYFAKKVSKPISQITTEIENIYKNQFEYTNSNFGIFSSIYEKISWLNRRLKSSKQMREEWISNITHDIKTPLSSIKGYAELLEDDKYDFMTDEVRMYAKEMLKAEQIIEDLLSDLRLSEQLEEGMLKLRKTNFDLVLLIKECIHEIPHKTIADSTIKIDLPDTIKYNGDRALLKRVFQNIIGNCFVHNNNSIELSVCATVNEQIHIIIADNGKGLSDEDCKHIFDRYYRGVNTSKITGSGLGMAIANSAIQIHGGKIVVKSQLGMGTKFIITL